MDHEHLTWPKVLHVFYRCEEPGRWLLGFALDLIEICDECRAACGDLPELLDDISERVGCHALALLRSRHRAEEAWQDLRDRSPEMLTQTLKRTPATFGMVDLLVDESHQQASIDRNRALLLAEAALEMAQRLPAYPPKAGDDVLGVVEEPLDPPARAEMLALAYGVLGNAYRVQDRDLDAVRTLAHAMDLLEELGEGPFLSHGRARILSFRTSLLMDHRRFSDAMTAIEYASEAAVDVRPVRSTLVADIAIQRSLVLGLAGHHKEAIAPLRALLGSHAESLPPRLLLVVRHTLATHLVSCGQTEAARRLLRQLNGTTGHHARDLDSLRISWLEARILCAEGHHVGALRSFKALQETFLNRDFIHESALLVMEIAGVLLALGRTQETMEHARQALTLFLPLRLSKEMHSALALLAKAAERQSLSHPFIAALLRYAQGGPLPAPLLWN